MRSRSDRARAAALKASPDFPTKFYSEIGFRSLLFQIRIAQRRGSRFQLGVQSGGRVRVITKRASAETVVEVTDTMLPRHVQSRYEKLPDFKQLLHQYDPQGKFRNTFLDTTIFGS